MQVRHHLRNFSNLFKTMLIEKYDEGAAAKQATPQKKGNKKWWALVITLIVIMLLAVTCPSKDDHKDALNGDISTAVTNTIVGQQSVWQLLGNFFVSKIVDATLESNLRYSNYLVCSVTRAELNDKKSILSVGVLSHVFVLFNKDDLQKLVDKEVGNAWEGLMGTGKELLGIGEELFPKAPEANVPAKPVDEEPAVTVPEEGQPQQESATPPANTQKKSLEDVIVEKAERAVEKGIDKAIEGFLEELLKN